MSIYQIYIRSFQDSNGDGVGDLNGVTMRLEYLKSLGIDMVWITPFYESPMRDNGYDIKNYTSIDPIFGTMDDFENLMHRANELGIGIMLDMVLNHTSTEHMWFQKALAGEKKYQEYYYFVKGDPESPPTNWQSKFGGSAWKYVQPLGAYYLHLFDETQADLNWENPQLREQLYNVVRFWMEKGVKGFRLDVINLISKPTEFLDDYEGDGRRFYTDGPKIHEYLKELNKNTFTPQLISVGEMSSTNIEDSKQYANSSGDELSMVFTFHHLKVDYKNNQKWTSMDFDFLKLKEILFHWQVGMQESESWPALFYENHDQPRVLSRFGNEEDYFYESATALATAMNLMRGTPFIYQGQEIGLTNPHFRSVDDFSDVESVNYYEIMKKEGRSQQEILKILSEKSRDNARAPMKWDKSENFGFTKAKPWLLQSKDQRNIVSVQLEDSRSVLSYYKKLISLRKENRVISHGRIQPILIDHPHLMAYYRYLEKVKILVISNFYAENEIFELGKKNVEMILDNGFVTIKDQKLHIGPYGCAVLWIESV